MIHLNIQQIQTRKFSAHALAPKISKLFLGLLFGMPLFALTPERKLTDFLLDSWTTEEGLNQNSVYDIVQTKDGYIWLGTDEGVARFDGNRFTSITTADGLHDNVVRSLLVDHDEKLWIATYDGGVSVLNKGKLKNYDRENGLVGSRIWSLLQTMDGTIWVAATGGVSRIKNGVINNELTQHGDEPGWFTMLFQDRSGAIWLSHQGEGLHRIFNGETTLYTTANGLISSVITSMAEDREGNLWIGSHQGLQKLSNGAFHNYFVADGLPSNMIETLFYDREDSLWIGTFDRGLSRLHEGVFENFGTKDGLNHPWVSKFFEDRNGSMYIGTNGGGLHRMRDTNVRVYTQKDGLPSDEIYSVFEGKDTSLWIGTEKGLSQYKNGVFKNYGKAEGLNGSEIWSLTEDREGRIWAGTAGHGIFILEKGKFHSLSSKEGLADNWIFCMLETWDGAMWIGSASGLNLITDKEIKFLTTANGLPNNEILSLHEYPQGVLWIGTNRGLCRYSNGKFQIYNTKNGLSNDTIMAIKSIDNRIWVGTSGGLNLIENGKIRAFTTRDGLFQNAIFQILSGPEKDLWMSGNRGVFKIQVQDVLAYREGKLNKIPYLHFGRGDGMIYSECNGGTQPAGAKSWDGQMWFPTSHGLVSIKPRQESSNLPMIYIESVLADGKQLDLHSSAQLSSTVKRLEFRYSLLEFLVPGKDFYQYKLEGFDEKWVDAGQDNVAHYTNIAPGKYLFRVRGRDSNGIWNNEGASYAFTIMPPLGDTLVFKVALGMLAFAAFAFFFMLGKKKSHAELKQKGILKRKTA